MAIHQLFDKFYALVFEELRVFLRAPVERHAHLPRARKDLWILDGDVVLQYVAADRRISLYDSKGVAVEITRAIEPRLAVEGIHVDDERVSFPPATGPTHPGVGRAFLFAVHVNRPA